MNRLIDTSHMKFFSSDNPKRMQIQVKMETKLETVAQKIVEKVSLHANYIALIYSGMHLECHRTIGFYNIAPDSLIFAITSLRAS